MGPRGEPGASLPLITRLRRVLGVVWKDRTHIAMGVAMRAIPDPSEPANAKSHFLQALIAQFAFFFS